MAESSGFIKHTFKKTSGKNYGICTLKIYSLSFFHLATNKLIDKT